MSLRDDEAVPEASEAIEAHAAEDRQAGGDSAAFPGDTGTLSIETRRVLVQLLLGPSIDARRQGRLWPVLLRDEALIRSRLHDLFLDLVVDHEQRVAFTRQAAAGELEVPILLRRASLTFVQSALLLYLRQRLTHADAQGERAVVALSEMQEHLRVYERDDNADHARFERQIVNAVEKAKDLSLLQRLRGGDERYEVAPTLKLLFPAEEIQALMRTYAALAADAGTSQAPAGDRDDDPAPDDDVKEDAQ